MPAITYRWTIEQDAEGRYHFRRDGEKCGAKYGYDTEADARLAIAQTQRWDRIAG